MDKLKNIFRSKYLFLISILVLGIMLISAEHEQSEEIQWMSIEEALIQTQSEPKKIFIDVYTDWCGWCKVMDRTTFKNKEVVAYVKENYYAVKLNAESNDHVDFKGHSITQRQLASQLRVTGFPTIVFADEKFEAVYPVSGYQKPAQFKKMLIKFNTEFE